MFAPGVEGWPSAGCPGCSMFVDQIGHLAHLHARDTSLVLVSRAPLAKIKPYRKRMGRTVRLKGKTVELSTTEFDLLELFLRNPGRVLTRDWIMDQLRGQEWEAFDRSIDIAVSRLRAKIEEDAKTPRFLKTIRKKGYLLGGEES